MSIVIIGGNERMVTRYENLCESYGCKAKAAIIYKYSIAQNGNECFSGSKEK